MGRIKDYVIWHIEEYGYEARGWEHVEEYLMYRNADISTTYEALDIENSYVPSQVHVTSPSVNILKAIQEKKLSLHDIDWRQFEEIVAELLSKDGYEVTLTQPTRDGGVDILATRNVPKIGNILSVWQAKKIKEGKKVGLETVRELADTRNEFKASKGIIVTSSFLSEGALKRIRRDQYILEGWEKPHLLEWIRKYDKK